MRKIAVSNEKGGVGKTTTAVNLAHGLALRGLQVLLVDLDSQGNCAASLGVANFEWTLADVLLEDCEWSDAVVPAREGLDLIPSAPRLAEAKDELIARAAALSVVAISKGRVSQVDTRFLERGLGEVEGYDYLILDCAPSRDVLNSNALRFVDEVVLPASVDFLATVGAGQHTMAIREAQEGGSGVRIAYVVPTFYDGRTIKSREILAQLKEFYGKVVVDPIPANVSVAEAPSFGQTVFEYAPRSTGARAYAQLVERVVRNGSK